ncbi:hypothetical protein [Streptomyces sp. CB01580]|uniref:hypothetical protein n=1 Tax=Streptomyces sp. CB01580 TaxID=1703933 RepID=UPI00093B7771|nr:hypothetical protein [Streptomyces sp. CB01580]OKJ33327.1 hypothetical protein AMK22_20840 [Streptomyces sp. CB01580]
MKHVRRAVRALLSAALAGVLLTGCGILKGAREGGRDTVVMDMQSAADRADAMLDATIKAVVPEIQWAHYVTTVGSCDVSRRRKVVTIISEQRRGNFLGVIERFWKKSGYKITAVRQSKERPAIFAQSRDGFGISLVFGNQGQATFEVATPCVQKSEVSDPKTKPNGLEYPLGEIPAPNVRSDFWSAEAVVPTPSPKVGASG